jgi:hypothetical protein
VKQIITIALNEPEALHKLVVEYNDAEGSNALLP